MILNKLYFMVSKNNSRKEFTKESNKWFFNAVDKYEKIDKDIIHEVETVNCKEVVDIIKILNIDIACFLGGEIAKADFINSPRKICLNYHSGLSPIYNGTKSYLWPMAENRPNLIGGTLMKMNERIDGGDIISHFLPTITKNDNASSLFMKLIDGAVELYTRAIEKCEKNEVLLVVPQERSIRYTKSSDWTFIQEMQLSRFYKSGKISRYLRDSSIIEVEEGDEILIEDLLNRTLKKTGF